MRLVPVAAGVAVMLAACSSKDSPPADESGAAQIATAAIPEVTFKASDFQYQGPDSIRSGVTEITMVNDGPSEHHLILVRIDSGHSYSELLKTLGPGAPPNWITAVGGDGGVDTGGRVTTIADLSPGTYAVLCFLQSGPDKPPHFALGMARELTVLTDRNPALPPVADAEIKLVDFGFEAPDLKAGQQVIRVVNAGNDFHEIVLVRLPEGKSAADLVNAVKSGGAPIGVDLGGNGALSPGQSNWWRADLKPGRYALVCFVPAPDGVPHVVKGMIREFTVS